MAEEFTENELATINEILKMQAGAAMTPEEEFGNRMLREESGAAMSPEEMQPVQPQNFGTPPQQGALPTAPDMTTEQGKAAYLQQAINNIKSRTTGRRETGSQKLANLATGALPKQAGSAMTPEEMQQLQMMRGQR
jgi:hypothetical protein|tara:strand:- start:4723 stop:5130 length:408 start_codon:yes stop_codon:yes gene_type:complete